MTLSMVCHGRDHMVFGFTIAEEGGIVRVGSTVNQIEVPFSTHGQTPDFN